MNSQQEHMPEITCIFPLMNKGLKPFPPADRRANICTYTCIFPLMNKGLKRRLQKAVQCSIVFPCIFPLMNKGLKQRRDDIGLSGVSFQGLAFFP